MEFIQRKSTVPRRFLKTAYRLLYNAAMLTPDSSLLDLMLPRVHAHLFQKIGEQVTDSPRLGVNCLTILDVPSFLCHDSLRSAEFF